MKIDIRDTDLLYALLNIVDFENLLGHPAIEIKRSSAPKVSKGFHRACEDIKATKKFVIYGGVDQLPLAAAT